MDRKSLRVNSMLDPMVGRTIEQSNESTVQVMEGGKQETGVFNPEDYDYENIEIPELDELVDSVGGIEDA